MLETSRAGSAQEHNVRLRRIEKRSVHRVSRPNPSYVRLSMAIFLGDTLLGRPARFPDPPLRPSVDPPPSWPAEHTPLDPTLSGDDGPFK